MTVLKDREVHVYKNKDGLWVIEMWDGAVMELPINKNAKPRRVFGMVREDGYTIIDRSGK